MLLAIDVGNSNISLGVFEKEELVFSSSIGTDLKQTSDQYAMQMKNLFIYNDFCQDDISEAIISSVVPTLTNVISDAAKKLIGKKPMVVSAGIKTGLNIKLPNSVNLGSDLVCTAVGTIKNYPLPAIIVDLGTVTTITAISKDGVLLGTSIMAGVGISLEGLKQKTANLPLVSIDESCSLIGTNTFLAIKSGITYGTACMIDGMCERYTDELGMESTLVMTGGYATSILSFCKKEYIFDEYLLLKGLKIIFDKNNKHSC
ncbi:MAG: type pantothenate kinase [Oscillospiraceae bacterium]|jgi:type III pantothenate kinase|nr:type pantothenate kinase [Oscillospiraceae bacterium]